MNNLLLVCHFVSEGINTINSLSAVLRELATWEPREEFLRLNVSIPHPLTLRKLLILSFSSTRHHSMLTSNVSVSMACWSNTDLRMPTPTSRTERFKIALDNLNLGYKQHDPFLACFVIHISAVRQNNPPPLDLII